MTYLVTGTARVVDITYQNSGGDTAQQSHVAVPMTNTSTGKSGITAKMADGALVYISAQNLDETGSVTCAIQVDGVTVKTTTSTGAYVIATCSGTVRA